MPSDFKSAAMRQIAAMAMRRISTMTAEHWTALNDAAAGVYLEPDRRDGVRGLVSHTWMGGTRPDAQHLTPMGWAILALRDKACHELCEWEAEVLCAAAHGTTKTWGAAVGAAWEALGGLGLFSGGCITPFGREVARVLDARRSTT